MVSTYYKIFRNTTPTNLNFILLSILLSITAILLGDWKIFFLPVIFFAILYFILGERFLIVFILITLFTLVGELNESLRVVVHLVDFTLLGILFLKKFGLNFHNYPKVPKSIIYFLILFLSAMLISAAVSSYPFAGVGIISEQIFFFIIVYVFYSVISNEQVIKDYLTSIIIVAFIYVIISLTAFFFEGYNLIDIISKNRTRISIVLTNPEVLTNFYVFTFPIALLVLLTSQRKIYKTLSIFTLFFVTVGLILTMSRAAILAVILSSSIVLFIIRRKIFVRTFIVISIIILTIVFYQPLNEIVSLLFRIEEGTSARDQLWDMSINIIRDHPVFGLGPGVYKYEYFNYLPFMLSDWWGKLLVYYYDITGGVNFSHNYFLVFYTEMGIIGFLTAVVFPILYLRIGIRTLKKFSFDKTNTYYLIVGLFAIGSSVIFRNFFNSVGLLYLGGLTANLPFWLILGGLIYFYQIPLSHANERS